MAEWTYDQIGDYLTDGFWEEDGFGRNHFDVGPGDTILVYVENLTAVEQQYAINALQMWGDVTGIQFQTTTNFNISQIDFYNNDPSGAYGGADEVIGEIISYSSINIPTAWVEQLDGNNDDIATFDVDSYAFVTYVHEIGHALGLGHAGSYDGFANFDLDYGDGNVGENLYDNDSWQATVMSYFSQDDNFTIDADYAYPITPQIADIVAIQELYGVPTTTRAGNTTYGYNSNAGGIWDQMTSLTDAVTFTIFDSAGIDTVDLSEYGGDQYIDLRPGGISDVFGLTGNAMIALNTIIENAIGGTGADVIVGNDANNVLAGLRGKDVLRGGDGDDLLKGGINRDWIFGGDGNDTIRGGGGNDNLQGQDGDDDIWGANGNDRLTGGLGDDALIGGNGADTFVFREADILTGGSDEIRDFQDNVDLIEIQGFASTDVNIASAGADAFDVTIGSENIHVVMNGGGTLALDDFIFA